MLPFETFFNPSKSFQLSSSLRNSSDFKNNFGVFPTFLAFLIRSEKYPHKSNFKLKFGWEWKKTRKLSSADLNLLKRLKKKNSRPKIFLQFIWLMLHCDFEMDSAVTSGAATCCDVLKWTSYCPSITLQLILSHHTTCWGLPFSKQTLSQLDWTWQLKYFYTVMYSLSFFCSTSLPLASARWFDQHFQAFHTLRSAVD